MEVCFLEIGSIIINRVLDSINIVMVTFSMGLLQMEFAKVKVYLYGRAEKSLLEIIKIIDLMVTEFSYGLMIRSILANF